MQQDELTILNIYAPNTGTPRYIRLIKRLRLPHNNSGDFNISIRQINETENQQGYPGLELRARTNKHNRGLHFKHIKYTLTTLNTQNIDRSLLKPILGMK